MALKNILQRATCLTFTAAMLSLGTLVGCNPANSFLDPSEVGVFEQKRPLAVPILKTLDTGYDEFDQRFVGAEDVRASDLKVVPSDYVIHPNDLLQISLMDVQAQGVETTKQLRVTESGSISLPLLAAPIQAAGLTEAQFEQAIQQAYRDANQLPNVQVSAVVIESRTRLFSIFGAVTAPNDYTLIGSDVRLMNALVLAHDLTSQTGIPYIYIIRQKQFDVADDSMPATEPMTAPTTAPNTDLLAPQTSAQPVRANEPLRASEIQPRMMMQAPTTAPTGDDSHIVIIDDKPVTMEGGNIVTPPTPGGAANNPTMPPTGAIDTRGAGGEAFAFNSPTAPSNERIIRVPVDELLHRGELKYNIVIRPRDYIWVPQPQIGYYYMDGHVIRTGAYNLSAQNVTVLQAVAAAGGLDGLAVPWRTMIVRHIGQDRQIFASIDLGKIYSGEEPDILLKPDDVVRVGTAPWAPFLAAFRNGFRITYGFGFLYDENFAPDNNNN